MHNTILCEWFCHLPQDKANVLSARIAGMNRRRQRLLQRRVEICWVQKLIQLRMNVKLQHKHVQ